MTYKQLIIDKIIKHNNYSNISEYINKEIFIIQNFNEIYNVIPNNEKYLKNDCISQLNFKPYDILITIVEPLEYVIYNKIINKRKYSREFKLLEFKEQYIRIIEEINNNYMNILPFNHYYFLSKNMNRIPKLCIYNNFETCCNELSSLLHLDTDIDNSFDIKYDLDIILYIKEKLDFLSILNENIS